jgi:hypothetical protein
VERIRKYRVNNICSSKMNKNIISTKKGWGRN